MNTVKPEKGESKASETSKEEGGEVSKKRASNENKIGSARGDSLIVVKGMGAANKQFISSKDFRVGGVEEKGLGW